MSKNIISQYDYTYLKKINITIYNDFNDLIEAYLGNIVGSIFVIANGLFEKGFKYLLTMDNKVQLFFDKSPNLTEMVFSNNYSDSKKYIKSRIKIDYSVVINVRDIANNKKHSLDEQDIVASKEEILTELFSMYVQLHNYYFKNQVDMPSSDYIDYISSFNKYKEHSLTEEEIEYSNRLSELDNKISLFEKRMNDSIDKLNRIEQTKSNFIENNAIFQSDNHDHASVNQLVKREGNTIYFGSYYQNSDKRKEPIKWTILREESGMALLISEKILDAVPYDEDFRNNYEKSHIRKWLNDYFYNTAFSDEEKSLIKVTHIDNSLYSTTDDYNKCICKNTYDKLFLLSLEEVNIYYEKFKDSRAECTEFAKRQGLKIRNENIGSFYAWFTRSPKKYSDNVHTGGSLSGAHVTSREGIRPALWISLDYSSKPDYSKLEEQEYLYSEEGNSIYFGSFYKNDFVIKEPIKWNVLKKEKGKALIITDQVVYSVIFDKKSSNYEKSFVRKWLNNDFYNDAFNGEEKSIILTTLVDNSSESTMEKNNEYICNDTNDKVFILSKKEANTYYKNQEERRASGTEYAKRSGLVTSDNHLKNEAGYVWLRSPDSSNTVKIVEWGTTDFFEAIDRRYCGVRPVIWIKYDE